ncbi:MAG: hypothetical protein ABL921_32495 [Pirellula sp.]
MNVQVFGVCKIVFRDSLIADIESLAYFGGIHETVDGFQRSLSRRFPFGIYYTVDGEFVTVVAILDLRREPLWIRDLLEDSK